MRRALMTYVRPTATRADLLQLYTIITSADRVASTLHLCDIDVLLALIINLHIDRVKQCKIFNLTSIFAVVLNYKLARSVGLDIAAAAVP